MGALDWLVARPIAHRGLHGPGAVENTATAFTAAIAAGYGIECDCQVSADGEAMVYHDDALGRVTEGSGALAQTSAAALKTITFKNTSDRMFTLAELCDLVGGRVPLLIELKSHFDGDKRLVERIAAVLTSYRGPVAAMSFDPELVGTLRRIAPRLARGIVAQRRYSDWVDLPARPRRCMTHMLHLPRTRPHFVAYAIRDLPAFAPLAMRSILGMPLLTWTVRTQAEHATAIRWADQMIFEGWCP